MSCRFGGSQRESSLYSSLRNAKHDTVRPGPLTGQRMPRGYTSGGTDGSCDSPSRLDLRRYATFLMHEFWLSHCNFFAPRRITGRRPLRQLFFPSQNQDRRSEGEVDKFEQHAFNFRKRDQEVIDETRELHVAELRVKTFFLKPAHRAV